jgi:hypothetical protein
MTGNPHDRLEIPRIVTGGDKSTVPSISREQRPAGDKRIVLLDNSGRHPRNSCQNYFPPPSHLSKSLP